MHEPSQAIRHRIRPREVDVGGLQIRRCLPAADVPGVGPWVFFDHIGPASFAPGEGLDVIPHPHINLATVTYLFEGELVHRDSLGSVQTITPGAVNLMVAGGGIVHSERTGPELRAAGHRLHGLQLWFALPEDHEEDQPAFYHYPAGNLPSTLLGEVTLRVLIGSAWGLRSPVMTYSPTVYVEAHLPAGASLRLPPAGSDCEQAVYLVSGSLAAGGGPVPAHSLALLACGTAPGREVELRAREDSRLALIGGAPPGKRHMWWNFVSSRQERIQQARADWQAGRFASVPGETERAVPPERDVFSEEHGA